MRARAPIAAFCVAVIAGTAGAEPRTFSVAEAASQNDVYPDRVTQFPQGVTGLADVTYSVLPGFRPLVLDLYLPQGTESQPLIVFVHGGGWVGGNTRHSGALADFPHALAQLAAEGFVVASVEYRLAGEAPFPAALQDLRAAVRFLKGNAAKYRIDAAKVAVWGGSAGGQLAALAATSCGEQSLDPEPAARGSECVQGAVIWYGVFDFAPVVARNGSAGPDNRFLGCSGECDAVVRRASPIAYVTADDPPFLLIHGDRDELVPVEQSQLMYERLVQAGVPAELIIVQNAGHSMSAPRGTATPTLGEISQSISSFLARYLK
jgi:acetyl esterase/lipase